MFLTKRTTGRLKTQPKKDKYGLERNLRQFICQNLTARIYYKLESYFTAKLASSTTAGVGPKCFAVLSLRTVADKDIPHSNLKLTQ